MYYDYELKFVALAELDWGPGVTADRIGSRVKCVRAITN